MANFNINLNIHYSAPEKVWDRWISLFKAKATSLLGYEIGKLEEGYDFKYYD